MVRLRCHMRFPPVTRGFSMIGLLITMVCIVVLFAILMNSMNMAVTGQKTQQPGTVRSFEDKMYLLAIYQSMLASATENRSAYITPTGIANSDDAALNTTANLFSAMLIQNYTVPKQLISGNEYSGFVWEKADYDFTAYNPVEKVFWDTTFQADLKRLSNVSFAHLPLCGKRFERKWQPSMDSLFPLFGNRGPKDGVNSANSYACGRDGVWRGHIVYGDGHIDFIDTPTPNGLAFEEDGQRVQDNIFALEDGPAGEDAIISFTQTMTKEGPQLQFD